MKKLVAGLVFTALLTGTVTAQTQPTDPATPTAPAQPAPVAQPTAAQYFANAQQLAAQAEIAYPQAFSDLPLWDFALRNAQAATDLEPGNLDYLRYTAELYTTTQWWIRAYDTWKLYESKTALNDEAKTQAALSAAKLGFLALQRGDKTRAVTYLQESLRWKDDADVRSLLQRAQG